MASWNEALRRGLLAGSLASVLSPAALVAAGRRRNGDATAPVNAISHWAWGDPALHRDGPSWRHTALGYAIHHGASLFWSTLHMRAWGTPARPPTPGMALAQAAVTSAAACLVDMKVAPRRLSPGFENRLPKRDLAATYALFALGLAVGAYAVSRRAGPPAPGLR
jgi:hypothetical protein